jgi:hypothetical protein
MNINDMLDEYIKNIDPEQVPLEYIKSLIITDFTGSRTTLTGDRMARFIADPSSETVAEAKVVLDIHKMKKDVIHELADIYDEIERRYNMRN